MIFCQKDAGFILRAFCATTPKRLLLAYLEKSIFKVFALDVGMLGAMAGQGPEILVSGEQVFFEFAGAFTESYVAQQLRSIFGPDL